MLENIRQEQSSALAYFDVFLLLAVLSVPLVALVFIMKPSVAQKGAHVSAE
jgi:DHA2 family multidrug resistance protein